MPTYSDTSSDAVAYDLDELMDEIEEIIERPSSQPTPPQRAVTTKIEEISRNVSSSPIISTVTPSHRNSKNNLFSNLNNNVNYPPAQAQPLTRESSFKRPMHLSPFSQHSPTNRKSSDHHELDKIMNELLEEPVSPLVKKKNSFSKVNAFKVLSPSNVGNHQAPQKISSSALTTPHNNMGNYHTTLHHEPVVQTPRKCSTVFIGNHSDSLGINSFTTFKRCNDLRCMKCDFKVAIFDGKKWKPDVNYLFFRNNYPDTVKKGFEEKDFPDFSSYCCQCTWISVNERTNLKNLPSINWYCGGHK
ncbi:hypothetical protein C9374_005357 [Naegleria lovaniensis]|uniref:Cilia- and flagella-associated protein 418 n=1 Tax=Naegleria lovaniensis TaxID=51637 RepID=A0AA88GQD3_NAELO|nr:uncharacterized protein C9374_005357 [Naegleria lovaniensis]KAG2382155.1 hypothetical protein C9374_005357 [Naegleria lovaniensis]